MKATTVPLILSLVTVALSSTVTAPPALAARTAPPIVTQCPFEQKERSELTLPKRISSLWQSFESSLYSYLTAAPLVTDTLRTHWVPVETAWRMYAKTTPRSSEEAAARKLWLASVSAHVDGIEFISNAQLDVLECYLQTTSVGLDDNELSASMSALALGTFATSTTSLSGRMNGLKGWLEWAAFADSYFAKQEAARSPLADSMWAQLRRGMLYGFLLQAHHDTYTAGCADGVPCYRKPDRKPDGLVGTTPDALWRYCYIQLDDSEVQIVMRQLAHEELNDSRPYLMRLPAGRQ